MVRFLDSDALDKILSSLTQLVHDENYLYIASIYTNDKKDHLIRCARRYHYSYRFSYAYKKEKIWWIKLLNFMLGTAQYIALFDINPKHFYTFYKQCGYVYVIEFLMIKRDCLPPNFESILYENIDRECYIFETVHECQLFKNMFILRLNLDNAQFNGEITLESYYDFVPEALTNYFE